MSAIGKQWNAACGQKRDSILLMWARRWHRWNRGVAWNQKKIRRSGLWPNASVEPSAKAVRWFSGRRHSHVHRSRNQQPIVVCCWGQSATQGGEGRLDTCIALRSPPCGAELTQLG